MNRGRVRRALSAVGAAMALLCAGAGVGEAQVSVIPGASPVDGLTTGTDGTLWGIAYDANGFDVVRLDRGGVLTSTAAPAGLHPVDSNGALHPLPDGSMGLFARRQAGTGGAREDRLLLLRFAAGSGALTQRLELPPAAGSASGVAVAPDGAVWFARSCADEIDRVAASGRVAHVRLGRLGCELGDGLPDGPSTMEPGTGLAFDGSGALWLANLCQGRVTRVALDRRVRSWRAPAIECMDDVGAPTARPARIVPGPDGGIFFAGSAGTVGETGSAAAGAITGGGRELRFPYGSGAFGADGALWHTVPRGVERRETTGAVTRFARRTPTTILSGLVPTRGGSVAFVRARYWKSVDAGDPHSPPWRLYLGAALVQLGAEGTEAGIPLPDGGPDAETQLESTGAVLGPDGAVWISEARMGATPPRYAQRLVRTDLGELSAPRTPVARVSAVLGRVGGTAWVQVACGAERARFCVGSAALAGGLARGPAHFAIEGEQRGAVPIALSRGALQRLRRHRAVHAAVVLSSGGGALTRRTVRLG
jgi:streptogramin lyase